jgi:hypothetical protein
MEYKTNPNSGRIEIFCPPTEIQVHSYEAISNPDYCRFDSPYVKIFIARIGKTNEQVEEVTGSSAIEIAQKYIQIPGAKKPFRLSHTITEMIGVRSDVTISSTNFDYKAWSKLMNIKPKSSNFEENSRGITISKFGSSSFCPEVEKAKALTQSIAMLYALLDISTQLKEKNTLYYPTEFLKSMNSQIDPTNVLFSFGIDRSERNIAILLDIVKKFCFDPDHYDIKKNITSRLPIKLCDTQTNGHKQIHTLIPEIDNAIAEFSTKLNVAYLGYINQKQEYTLSTNQK